MLPCQQQAHAVTAKMSRHIVAEGEDEAVTFDGDDGHRRRDKLGQKKTDCKGHLSYPLEMWRE